MSKEDFLNIQFEEATTRWEHFRKAVPDALVDQLLAEAGEDGWELVAVVPCAVLVRQGGMIALPNDQPQPAAGVMCFFKRPVAGRAEGVPEASAN